MLTEKQKRFCDEYLIDLNATQAAIRAGYSEKTANEQGNRLLANVSVQAYIQKRMNDRSKRTEITQDKVLNELAKIGFADIKQFLSYRTEKTVVGNDPLTGTPIAGYQQIVEAKPSDDVDGAIIQEVSIGKDGTFKFKLHDKMSALEKIGKHLGMYTDKVESKVTAENTNVNIDNVPEEEKLKLIKKIADKLT